MKMIKTYASTALLLAAAAGANAATYDMLGAQNVIAPNGGVCTPEVINPFPLPPTPASCLVAPGALVAGGSFAGTAEVDDTGGVFNSATLTYSSNTTSPASTDIGFTTTTTVFTDGVSYTTETSSCVNDAGKTGCTNVTIGVPSGGLLSAGYDGGTNATGLLKIFGLPINFDLGAGYIGFETASLDVPLAALQNDINGDPATSDIINNYYLTPQAPIPVPAAAWLFGSGLLGLAGIARRRKVQAS